MKRTFVNFRGMCLGSLARFAFAVSFGILLIVVDRLTLPTELDGLFGIHALSPGILHTVLLFVYEQMETFAGPLVWLAAGVVGEVLLRAVASRLTLGRIARTAGLWLFPGLFLLALALPELGRWLYSWAILCACLALAAFLWDLGGLIFNWPPTTYPLESRLASARETRGRAFQVLDSPSSQPPAARRGAANDHHKGLLMESER